MPRARPAGGIEQEILRRFSHSGSPTADLLLSWATEAIEAKNYPLALDVLDQIIVIKPDFAEAWNKRATVYYLIDDYSASLSDIRQRWRLQPRHFGALAGFGMILEALDRKAEAIRVFKRALEIDPRLDQVSETLEKLEKENEGSGDLSPALAIADRSAPARCIGAPEYRPSQPFNAVVRVEPSRRPALRIPAATRNILRRARRRRFAATAGKT